MNKYLKSFLHRGLIFGGFGPIITAIIYFIISASNVEVTLGGADFFTVILSTYVLAFLHAGASVFNQIEEWPLAKSLFCHLGTLYLAYSSCYIINSWIAFEPIVLLVFTAVFAAVYFTIWLTVYLIIKTVEKKLNSKIK